MKLKTPLMKMKTAALLTLLLTGTVFTERIDASAVKACVVKARVKQVLPKKENHPVLLLEVLSAEFHSGHSMGTDCACDSSIEVELKNYTGSSEFKAGQTLTLMNTIISNVSREGMFINRSWSIYKQ